MRKKGDILQATHRDKDKGLHFIIFWEGYDENNFVGGMITHLETKLNTPMHPSHFLSTDPATNKKFKVQYDNSFLVIAKLRKLESWRPFSKEGMLSEEGIIFVNSVIGNLGLETWEEYLLRTNQ